jgi:twinkle protein
MVQQQALAINSPKIQSQLSSRGLDVQVMEKYGIHSLPVSGGGECLVIPFLRDGVAVNKKYRTFGEQKKFWQQSGGQKLFWNEDVLRNDSMIAQALIITEGEMDALAAIQSGFLRTISVPEGAPAKPVENTNAAKYTFIDAARPLLKLDRVSEIILAVDNDEAGANLLQDLALRLDKSRCKWVKYPKREDGTRCKDLNEVLQLYGQKGVVETINKAEWMHVDGIYSMNELPPIAEQVSFDIGFPYLRDNYRVRLGDMCTITGIPSMGKSTFVNDLCCRLANEQGLQICFASFEQAPQLDHRRNLRTWYLEKPVQHGTSEEIAEADQWIDQMFTFMVPSDDDDVTLEWLVDKMKVAVLQRGANVIVIDPWNECDHTRDRGESLTEYTGRAIKLLKRFAKAFNVHLIVVAHPAKMHKDLKSGEYSVPTMYDISDSSHWYNKSDIGIVVHQAEGATLIRVAKSRYHDSIGKPGDRYATFHFAKRRYEIHP